MFRFLALFLISLALPATSFAASLAQVEGYLAGMKTLSSEFTQQASDGSVATGIMHLKRPLQMRWQYHPPTPILMVTRSGFLTYVDYDLQQVSDIPLEDTLLSILSRPKIDLQDPSLRVEYAHNQLSFQQKKSPDNGKLTLIFQDAPLQLVGLEIVDATGQTTQVSLQSPRINQPLDDAVFAFRDPRIGGTRRNRGKRSGFEVPLSQN